MNEEIILFQYQVKTKSQYGTRFYYFYADTDIENYLNNKNIKYVRHAKDTALNKKEKRIKELFKENKQLKEQKENLQNIVCNKIMTDYDIETPLKDELSKQIAKNIVLEESKNITEHIIDELEKWLKKQINYLTKIDGQNIPLKDDFEFCSMNELYQTGKYSGLKDSLNKLQELKGSDENV